MVVSLPEIWLFQLYIAENEYKRTSIPFLFFRAKIRHSIFLAHIPIEATSNSYGYSENVAVRTFRTHGWNAPQAHGRKRGINEGQRE